MFAKQENAGLYTVTIPVTASYLVLDIETGDAQAEEIEKRLNGWKPPANYRDPAKIDEKRKEAFDKIMSQGALLDASPILCIAVKCEKLQGVFSQLDCKGKIEGWNIWASGHEADMLKAFRVFLNKETSKDTIIVGHNVRGFDLPKLRNAYIRNRLRLPDILEVAQRAEDSAQVTDTAQLFKAFSMQHRNDYVPSLSDMAESLNLLQPKGVISGEDIPGMYKERKYQEILTYCAIDTIITEQAYLLMTGQTGELQ